MMPSTNLVLPVPSCTRIATNSFGVTGTFSFTNAIVPGLPQNFYRLQLQKPCPAGDGMSGTGTSPIIHAKK